MKVSQTCIDLIKTFERCELQAYKDPAGVWTIGYGHTGKVFKGMTITQSEAEEFLRQDLVSAEIAVKKYDRVYHWNQNQFDALVSFAFNLGGINNLTAKGTRTIEEISNKILLYKKAGGKTLPGLMERRIAEKELFDRR
jgi:GH24 family phage-related lysozyme (muramidase)